MSDHIGHYCGLALVRLRKPLTHFVETYGDPVWGLRRLYLLMEKQRNRGQDGAGIGAVKFDMPEGEPYLVRTRSAGRSPIASVFRDAMRGDGRVTKLLKRDAFTEVEAKKQMEFLGELSFGHLRYGTHGGHGRKSCHPFVRRNNVPSRNIALAGNFNMTNSRELFDRLVEYGLHPVGESDTQVILEKLSFALDNEHDHLRATMGPESFQRLEGIQLAAAVSKELNLARVLENASKLWDGGYAFMIVLGNGDAMVCRDPAGIRQGFYFMNDEVFAFASERAALVTVFDVNPDEVQAVKPGHALIIKRDGRITQEPFTDVLPERSCTFERIYFSRGNDRDIYRERKSLGRNLAPRVLEAIDNDLENTVFNFIPNTAESAFHGLIEEIAAITQQRTANVLWRRIEDGTVTRDELDAYLNIRPRNEKAAHKDQKLRTFISKDKSRGDLVSHVYDITPDVVSSNDTLVMLDDSIVRGTTLRDSIITMLSRLNPKRIIIVSSAPPIMYPDCYGIDMSQLGRFIAFEATIALIRERCHSAMIDEVAEACREQRNRPPERMQNHVAKLYDMVTLDDMSAQIAKLIRSNKLTWKGELDVIYQTIDGLHAAMPDHTGDWYFTGNYPTPGGYKVLNTAYLKWIARDEGRSYEE